MQQTDHVTVKPARYLWAQLTERVPVRRQHCEVNKKHGTIHVPGCHVLMMEDNVCLKARGDVKKLWHGPGAPPALLLRLPLNNIEPNTLPTKPFSPTPR